MVEPTQKRPFWISWYQEKEFGGFELHSPWWISGERVSDSASTICAAVMAIDEDAACEIIASAHDNPPGRIEFRFVEERDPDWSPFSDRFPRADWMQWPPEATP